ncbi:cupin domain-containing protein [Mizugakiibacter sediminis]|nr:cupin domain-containing protein [Mizugakiibacter sediminis]
MPLRFAIHALLLPVALACAGAVHAHGVGERALLEADLANVSGAHLSAITVTYAPGAKSSPHRHAGAAFVYVLAGRVRSQVEGQPVRTYRAGESWFEPAGALHAVCENPSARTPAEFLVVFVEARAPTPATP